MTLAGARIALSGERSVRADLLIQDGRVFRKAAETRRRLDLEGFLILPGLINSHDHLEFNLFPRLGRGPYPNATAWAEDIYRPAESPVREHLRVPKPVRLTWGGVKNLLAGVTSVLHHNPYEPGVFDRGFPVRVIKRFRWGHSLRFSEDLKSQYRRRPRAAPFVIHACEGADADARSEVFRLNDQGVLGPTTVIVHGVALDREGIALVKRKRASLVWCPTSNQFTLGRTISPEILESRIPIALGTDSALTAEGDLVDELQFARAYADAGRLYRMVTTDAARILGLRRGEGSIRDGGVADLVVVRDRGQTPAEALFDLHPELMLVGGQVKLLSEEMTKCVKRQRFNAIEVEGRGRWRVNCDIPALAVPVRQAIGDFRLGGKRVAA